MNWEDLKSRFLSENQDIIIKYRELPSVVVDTNVRRREASAYDIRLRAE